MSRDDRIAAALRRATDTRSVVIALGALSSTRDAFAENFGIRTAVVVADETTYRIAGAEVHKHLSAAPGGAIAPFVFPVRPALYADFDRVLELEAALRANDAIPVAVGSGTLNDLTKLAAHRCGRPYMVVATAASMDGYTAFGAAITHDGFKQTFSCPAPQVVVADLAILADAPPAMTASGYADLLGKVTAGADWIIADALGIEPIEPHAWSLVQHSLRDWTADPGGLSDPSSPALADLVEGLMLTGLAMQSHQSSRPASGSEHQFSHLWEMQDTTHSGVSHGFKVGLGSLASAALYQRLLVTDMANLDIPGLAANWPGREATEAVVRQSFADPVIQQKAVEQSLAKYVGVDLLRARLELLRSVWPSLQTQLTAQLLPVGTLQRLLRQAHCPTTAAEIGKTRQELRSSYALAGLIRSRYTVFDLAAQTGCLAGAVDALFKPGGFWSEATNE